MTFPVRAGFDRRGLRDGTFQNPRQPGHDGTFKSSGRASERMARVPLAVFGSLVALFPERVLNRYGRVAFEPPRRRDRETVAPRVDPRRRARIRAPGAPRVASGVHRRRAGTRRDLCVPRGAGEGIEVVPVAGKASARRTSYTSTSTVRSNACPARNTVASSKGSPTNINPTGRPSDVPAGTLMAGWPVLS